MQLDGAARCCGDLNWVCKSPLDYKLHTIDSPPRLIRSYDN